MMEIYTILEISLLSGAIFYFAVHLFLYIGIKSIKHSRYNSNPFVSIIVAARNEESTIGQLLKCLLNQTYENYEIIIVNDRSTDKTAEIIKEYQSQHQNILRIDIDSVSQDMPAKKNALRAGINASSGEILCFTDADCLPSTDWIKELVNQFEPKVGLVAGYSPYIFSEKEITNKNFLKKIFFNFIHYEEARAGVWSAGSIGLKLGWLCTGRNLAYRRKVYDEVDGFEKIKMSISGDDDLFLQLVRRETNWEIRYLLNSTSFVPTYPPKNFKEFLEQRKRHFSAAKYFTLKMKLFFILYNFFNLYLFISPLLYLLNLIPLITMLLSVITKILADLILFKLAKTYFKLRKFESWFLLMEIIYIFYNSIIGMLGIFRKFQWKATQK